MVIHIADRDTDILVRRLADAHSASVTETVKAAVIKQLEAEGLPTHTEDPPTDADMATDEGLIEALHRRIYKETQEYVRLQEKVSCKKSNSRVFGMLKRHKVIETLRRLFAKGRTDGLVFLHDHDRLDLAAENTALDKVFERVIPEDIRASARANLAALKELRKPAAAQT
jgi:hypothetical protein